MAAGGRLGAVEGGRMAPGRQQRSSRTMPESAATQARLVVAPPVSDSYSGGNGGGQAGAASCGEAPPTAGEGRSGLVSCPQRGAPALENARRAPPPPCWRRRAAGDAVESTAAVEGVVQR